MAKDKQAKKEFTEDDMREPKPDSIERDEKNGWDHKEQSLNGASKSALVFDTPPKNQDLIYVKMADGSFRFSPRPQPNPLATRRVLTLPHSVVAQGEKVIGAGECSTDSAGKIKEANNQSGHYQPKEINLEETKKNMEEQGLSTPDATWTQVF
jgi:hypothetical protein